MIRTFSRFRRKLSGLVNHPLTRDHKAGVLARYVGHHAARLLPRPLVHPYVNGLRLIGYHEAGVTGNIYCGLHDFEDAGFLLHYLRPDDLFVDVGANVGTYTLLAAGAAGARTVAVEPVPGTFARLLANLKLNGIENRVRAWNGAAGARRETLSISTGRGALNSIVRSGGESGSVAVPVQPLDELLAGEVPALIKIDVEGFEYEVLNGAAATLAAPGLRAVIIELNGSGQRYGVEDRQIHDLLTSAGFAPYDYEPFTRSLAPLPSFNTGVFNSRYNTLYLRDADFARARVADAQPFHVRGRSI